MYGAPYPAVGPAAAEIARHRLIDVFIAGVRISVEEGHRRHDLTRVAVSALGHVIFDPRPLNRVTPVGREAFYRNDLLANHGRNGGDAGPDRLAVHEDRAGAAPRDAAAVLRAREPEVVPYQP